ncbi:hypothetical protein NTD86_24125 [Pseudomonas sp. 7P_10.2_Bac1]|uniref:hypothetical protein n=1 Tax=Pseudomonas sp. 7P_10.2_Bac1 TaxID=2971614 RepID=UPI0021C568A3|nr:hypothetical protein [Pseudomonas sp. 7P_10.2_Bac1]MCU1730057.1 hypothetical protein [Pseudomonas sp. 7P_10.2_Bac1]
MSPAYYLPRKLTDGNRTYTEEELLLASDYVIVLSEPGGGKSSLLESLAQRLEVACVTANVFSHLGGDTNNSSLVIDAFDELAKIDQTGIHRLLANATKSHAKHVVISSRSSEWGTSSTQAFTDFFRQCPLVVRLCEFDKNEQKSIFDQHVPGEHFKNFRNEVSRFDLESLLPNPQFLKLFADAYVESGRHFENKRSIFSLAVERLSREVNPKIASKPNSLSVVERVDFGSEIFAKLLLCGSDGVTKNEASESRIYPFMGSLSSKYEYCGDILATRLFKPGDLSDQHRPVHKVVVEYCAASYLTNRIRDSRDFLTLTKCLPVIAPNSIVRDELRGLIGWMAALGTRDVQAAVIQLDPYAVLANGDPSQLEPSSKRLLIRKLKEIEIIDPYFRRGDFGRRFSVAGFFTRDVVDEVRSILVSGGEGHLRDLILELLVGSKETKEFEGELVSILLASRESESARFLASKCLIAIAGRNHKPDLMVLIDEATHTSLRVAAEFMKYAYSKASERALIFDFLRACASLYPEEYNRYDRIIESRFFVKQLIVCLECEVVGWLLDELCLDLVCTCAKEVYECKCKIGTSKIMGYLLDRYFDVVAPPHDPVRVWRWVENLNYHNQIVASQSKAVEILQQDINLRQGIIAVAFGNLTDREEIFKTKIHKFEFHSHSGLMLFREDKKFLADLAFELGNPILWSTCIPSHQKHQSSNARGPDDLRCYLRGQALAKPEFMHQWVKVNRSASELDKLNGLPANLRRKINRSKYKRKIIREKNAQYVRENRQLIESGSHWRSLERLAVLTLMETNGVEEEFGDKTIALNALRNCIDFIAPHIPELQTLAELSCASKGSGAVRILFAACLEIMREQQSLECIDLRLLKSVRASINVHYRSVSDDENKAIKREIDRLIFAEDGGAEDFIRAYVETQLAIPGCNNPDVWLLRGDEAFSQLRSKLSIEWLTRFEELKLDTDCALFDIAVQYADRDSLKAIIMKRCSELIALSSDVANCEDLKQKRLFWFLADFYFNDDISKPQWDWLQVDAENIFAFYERSGKLRNSNSSWPSLTAVKVKAVLDAFISSWPEVELNNQWGNDSPKEENAYRFIQELVWSLSSLEADEAIPVIQDLLADCRYEGVRRDLSSIHSAQFRRQSLRDYEAPFPRDIVSLLDTDSIVTVEGLRQFIIDELHVLQGAINGGEFNSGDRFYDKEKRLGEIKCSEVIAERLSIRLESLGVIITQEHQLKESKRSDFTAAKIIDGKRKLLVTEVKGQWHAELYTAAQDQLHDRYSIHPDAEQQGIYIVLWFGGDELIAGRKNSGVATAEELKLSIQASLPRQLSGLLDIFVLDVSKSRRWPSV